jgi:copper(I)-binding protein
MLRFLLILVFIFPGVASAELDIHNAWIKNLPPAVPVRAGYMTIRNAGANAISIIANGSGADFNHRA